MCDEIKKKLFYFYFLRFQAAIKKNGSQIKKKGLLNMQSCSQFNLTGLIIIVKVLIQGCFENSEILFFLFLKKLPNLTFYCFRSALHF